VGINQLGVLISLPNSPFSIFSKTKSKSEITKFEDFKSHPEFTNPFCFGGSFLCVPKGDGTERKMSVFFGDVEGGEGKVF
jgi:hypothetical protein